MKTIKQKLNLIAKENTPLNQLARVYKYWTNLGYEVNIIPKVSHG